ncbi:hypothetical protein Tco_1265132 [Tanacetum coccineum]
MSTQQDINAIRAQRLANTHDLLALMANSQTPFHPDQSSLITYLQHPQPNNNFVPPSSFNANYMQQLMQNPKDISDPTIAIDMALVLMAKEFTLNDTTPTNNNQRSSSNPNNMQIAQPDMNMDQDRQMLMVENNVKNQFRPNAMQNVRNQVVQIVVQNLGVQNVRNYNGLSVDLGIANQYGIRNVVTTLAEGNGNGINGIQSTQEEFNFMAAAGACKEIERANANCTLENNLRKASTSSTQSDKAPIYDSDKSAVVHLSENCYDNDIFNMFTQEEQYTELLEPIPKPHQVPQNDSNVIFEVSNMEQVAEVEKVNSVNRKMKETNAELTTDLARYKNQEKCFEISQEKYDKRERCYQQSVYQEQCLTKKINALHLSSGKQITALNEEISNLNKQLSKEKSTVSSLQEEKKRLKSDFKIHEDELLDKQIQLENKIKELDNILVKTDEIFPIVNQVDARVQNFEIQFLKEAAKLVRDFQSLAKEANESLAKHKALELDIERLLRAVISQDIVSIMKNPTVIETSDLQIELDRIKERLENCIFKKEKEYALWHDWYKKCEEWKYDKISYDKAYNDMQQKIKRLQAQLGDQKGKIKDTPCVSNTLDHLSQKLVNENVELEFQIKNYAKENDHLKTAYKNLFDSINVFEQKNITRGTSANTKFAKQSILGKPPSSSRPKLYVVTPLPKSMAIPKVGETNALSNQVTSKSVPSSQDLKVVENDNVIAPGMFRIDPWGAFCQNQRDLPRNSPLDRVEVLGMIEKRSKMRKGIVATEMELVLEQTQQGTSHEVSCGNAQPSLATQNSSKDFCFISHEDQHVPIIFLIPRSLILKGWQDLNIGSLKAFNLALLQKWRWRMYSFPNALWIKVIKVLHGQEGGFDNHGCKFNGAWARIVGPSNYLHLKDIIPLNSFCFQAGCGTKIQFWKDVWIGDSPLNIWSNIRVCNMAYLHDLLLEISLVDTHPVKDSCLWSLANDGIFSVGASLRIIDAKLLPSLVISTSWDKILPHKVNIFMWRLSLDRLPHRLNLSSCGIDIPKIS